MDNTIKMLYLYPSHDADLYGLLKETGIKDFRSITRDSLRVLLRPGYVPKISVPKFKPVHEEKYEKVIAIPLSLKSEKDEDVRELLSHVRYRQLNTFIKTAMRFYIGAIPALSCLLDMELIKTVPVYTPNGVIVFPNTMNIGSSRKSPKQKKETIKKANDIIVRTVKENKATDIKTNPESYVEDDADNKIDYKNDMNTKVIDSDVCSSNLNGNSDKNIAESFSENAVCDEMNGNTEVDVLSLLENLLG